MRDMLRNHIDSAEQYWQVCMERDAVRNLLKNRGR